MPVVGWVVRCGAASGGAQLPYLLLLSPWFLWRFVVGTPVGGRWGCIPADRRALVVRCHHVISAVVVRYFAHRWVAAGGVAQLAVGKQVGVWVEKVGRVSGDRVRVYRGMWRSRVYVSRPSKRVKPASNSVPRSGVRELLLSMVIVIFRRCNVKCAMYSGCSRRSPGAP